MFDLHHVGQMRKASVADPRPGDVEFLEVWKMVTMLNVASLISFLDRSKETKLSKPSSEKGIYQKACAGFQKEHHKNPVLDLLPVVGLLSRDVPDLAHRRNPPKYDYLRLVFELIDATR